MDLMLISVSFILSCFTIILSQRYFLQNNYIDKINNRSSHSSVATRTGGIALFSTLFLISLYFYLTGYDIFEFSLLIPFSLLTFVGLYDDINGVDFKLKFVFQIIAAKIIIDNGFIIDIFHVFAGFFEITGVFAQALTIFIFLAIITAIIFFVGFVGFVLGLQFFLSYHLSFFQFQ